MTRASRSTRPGEWAASSSNDAACRSKIGRGPEQEAAKPSAKLEAASSHRPRLARRSPRATTQHRKPFVILKTEGFRATIGLISSAAES